MAAAQVSEGHLTPEARQRLGPPDLVLCLGDTRFPVHSALLETSSGVLASLLKECGTIQCDGEQLQELSLANIGTSTGSQAASSQGPAAAITTQQLQLYLGQLYSHGAHLLGSEQQALDLLKAADYLDSPSLFRPADEYLALQVLSQMGNTEAYGLLRPGIPSDQLAFYLSLASKHRLLRLTAVCLPLLWTLEGPHRAEALNALDPVVLAASTDAMSGRCGVTCDCTTSVCEDPCCKAEFNRALLVTRVLSYGCCCDVCRQRQEVEWRRAAVELQQGLRARGWGHA